MGGYFCQFCGNFFMTVECVFINSFIKPLQNLSDMKVLLAVLLVGIILVASCQGKFIKFLILCLLRFNKSPLMVNAHLHVIFKTV